MLNEINVLCIGELIQQKSAFLCKYTCTQLKNNNSSYQIFSKKQRIEREDLYVFFHEVKQREGMQVFIKYPFDAVLFFVKIDFYHKTVNNILESLRVYSQVNGCNIYQIPIKVIVISHIYGIHYEDISQHNKRKLYQQLRTILNQNQIIYVQFSKQHEQRLNSFYQQIKNGQPSIGIKESVCTNWFFQGVNYFSYNQVKLSALKVYQEFKRILFRKQKREEKEKDRLSKIKIKK